MQDICYGYGRWLLRDEWALGCQERGGVGKAELFRSFCDHSHLIACIFYALLWLIFDIFGQSGIGAEVLFALVLVFETLYISL